MMQGRIIKGIAGFYYVHAGESGVYACRAKGIFRKEKKKPLVGDYVEFEITHEKDREGNVTAILPRKNELIRPAASNVDQALLFFAMKDPAPSTLLLDRYLLEMQKQHVPSILCFNKTDLAGQEEEAFLRTNYQGAGCQVLFVSVREAEGLDSLRELLTGRTTLLAGPSGAGKSSLTNACLGRGHMEVGEISKKLSRGKNTTRHAEIVSLDGETAIMDTPGFSLLETYGIESGELRFYYPEFALYEGKCRFDGCVHLSEPDCAVKEALEAGLIPEERYENYRYLYEECREKERHRYS